MTWRVQCRLYGPDGEPRWFVQRDLLSGAGTEFVLNERGRPMPYATEQQAEEKAAQLNDIWEDFDVRR
jgi:hypothetical protein